MTDPRDQIAETATQWALMYPLANWPPHGRISTPDDQEHLDAIANKLAAAWGSDIAECALAVVQPALDAKDAEIERLRKLGLDLVAKRDTEIERLWGQIHQRDAAIERVRAFANSAIHDEVCPDDIHAALDQPEES